MSTLKGNGVTASYKYDADGLRSYKKVGNVESTYQYLGDKLVYEKRGNIELEYGYNSFGDLAFIRYNTSETMEYYYVVCNSRGDVEDIYNGAGELRAHYTYDSWGNVISITDQNGKEITSSTHIGILNPIRYRGYYYDAETGMYYVGSRYYDPQVGRWINADDSSNLGAEGEILSYNLFAYCMNNPINRVDVDGNWSLPNWAKVTIGAVALAGAIALTVATGGGAAAVAIGVAKIVGSVALSTAVSAGAGYLQNGKQGAIDGACNGFMFGSLSALGGAAFKYAKVHSATTGSPNSMGRVGERMAGIDQSAKQPIQVNGRTRIPDALTNTTLTEVKNVKYISNTRQLRDFATYANMQRTPLKLELWVRPTTRVAQTVIDAGWHINYLW